MFKVIISILCLPVCYGIYAQGKPSIQLNQEKMSGNLPGTKKSFGLPQLINPKDVNKNNSIVSVNPAVLADTARYSHSTPNGMVYLLPGSNMPIFKPSTGLQVMPGTAETINPFIPQSGQIPNGLKPRVMFFEKPPEK